MVKPLPLTLLRVINPCHLHDPNGMSQPDDTTKPLSKHGVHIATKTIVEKGWLDSKPKVYAPVPHSQMKELVERNDHEARAELDAMRFKVLDGAHRVRAIRSLMQDPSVSIFNCETRIMVEVARETRSVVQRILDTVAENAKNTRVFREKDVQRRFMGYVWNPSGGCQATFCFQCSHC
jgi:hypothetical protein